MSIRKITPAVTLVVAMLGLGAAPAWAHTSLKSTNPEEGAQIASPRRIELTFTDPVRVPRVILTGDDGARHERGSARAVDSKVVQAVKGTLPNGTYTVGWRVVSSDGHPVSGSYEFTVRGSTASASPGAAAPAPTTPAPATSQAPGQEEESSTSGWLWIGAAAVVVAAVAGGVAWARRPTED